MDIELETLKILKAKNWSEELKTEIIEVLSILDKEKQERLLNILKSDKITLEHIKQLFSKSTSSSLEYKMSQTLKYLK